MSRTAVLSTSQADSTIDDDLRSFTNDKSTEPLDVSSTTTFGRMLLSTRHPPKFDGKGRRTSDWESRLSAMTPLQRHVAYFLPHADAHIIYPIDTFHSVRAWGWSLPLVLLTIAVIHLGLAYFTQPSHAWLPDPRLGCYLENMHRAKHGSDSGSYNSKGKFKREMFDDFFTNYDRDNKGGLTIAELYNAWCGQRLILDPFGWSAAAFEWIATYLLLWPADGVLRKKDVEGVFNGEIFWRAKELEDIRRVGRGLKPVVY